MRYKLWVIIAIVLFVAGIGAGLILSNILLSGDTGPAVADGFLSEAFDTLEELLAAFGPFQVTTAIFIFANNAITLLFSFMFSPILCLIPMLTLLLNGSLLSFIAVIVVQEESLGYLLAGLLPHGIIEIPAFIIGEAAALSFGAALIVAIFYPGRRQQLLPNLKQNLKYLLLAIVLLVPAAIIETFVTPLFLR